MLVSSAGRVEIFQMIFMFFCVRPAFVPAGNQINRTFTGFNNNAPCRIVPEISWFSTNRLL